MRALPAALLAVLLATTTARADGKFYSERVPPGLPYQRALIMFDGEREVLVLQSKYEFADEGEMRDFGWVVPVPSEPGLASMSSALATDTFWGLSRASQPRIVHYGPAVAVFVLVWFVLFLFAILVTDRFPALRRQPFFALLAVAGLLVVLFLFTLTIPMGGTLSVDVLRTAEVGIYDVKVVRSGDPDALVAWLRTNGFRYGPADETGFARYVERGWCFVAARISPERAHDAEQFVEGLPDPLVLDFATDRAVYPLALTALAGTETEVLLYVLAKHRVAADRLETLAAREGGEYPWHRREPPPEAWGDYPPVLKDPRFALPWLTKLKGRLSPEEMRGDLVLEYAEADEAYRETRYRW